MNLGLIKISIISMSVLFICFFNAIANAMSTEGSKQQPNILWLVVEDMSPILPAYGDNTISTPNITWLAKEGVKYTNVYSTSGVCAPSRAALALGMYPSAMGANHMRTISNTEETGLPKYEAVPPPEARMLSQHMRALGYYTTNNYKTDYQFEAPKNAWDESSVFAHWRNRPAGTPFFSVVNFTTTHESGLFEPYGIREIESRHFFADSPARIASLSTSPSKKSSPMNTPIHIPKNLDFPIPPYLPDTRIVRRDLWKMYNNLAETDRQIGAVLEQLKQDGLLDSTVIFFYSDHGGPLPRQKRLIYDSGLKVPLIIRFPNGKRAGEVDDQLISFVDFVPTTIKLAGMKAPTNMHGQDFIQNGGNYREFIHAAADRFDGFTDVIRAVKNKQFKYIRNYKPEQAYYLPVAYREKIPSMQELISLHNKGSLSPHQAQWFRQSKHVEELFDTVNDPHELNNLANNSYYAEELEMLSDEMDRWLAEVGDIPSMSEVDLIAKLWQGSSTQPQTKVPLIHVKNGLVYLSSETQGASISYKIIKNEYEPSAWEQYLQPFDVPTTARIKAVAHRIGYQESEVENFTVVNRTTIN